MISKEENELLCRTGPGTSMGELFRRFWLPVALSRELPKADCPPVRLRILSEDLIAFRDTSGHVGLLSPPVMWESVEVLNRFQWKTRYSSTAVNSSIQRQRLDTQCIQSYLCRCITTPPSVPIQEFLHKFGTLNWTLWNAHYGIAIAQAS